MKPQRKSWRERQLTRQLLQELSEAQRELLYRLTLAVHPVRRDQAILLCDTPPPVAHGGDVFDSLVGRWIESISGNYYQLSPLLSRAGEAVWSADRVKELRTALGFAIVKAKRLTLTEASEVLLQALATGVEELAGLVLMPLVCMSRARDDVMAAELSWLLVFTSSKEVFTRFRFLNLMLRELQFRIGAVSEKAEAAKFAGLLEEESLRQEAPEIPWFHPTRRCHDAINSHIGTAPPGTTATVLVANQSSGSGGPSI